jgi:hypothetical protein
MDTRHVTKDDQGQQTKESEQHRAEVPTQTTAVQAKDDATGDTLRAAYEEISRSHLAITDFRGKLLGLLPLATGVGIFLLLDNTTTNAKPALLAAAGVFGVLVTTGLFFYELRGMDECHMLRKRGAELEKKLLLMEDCSRFQNYMPGFIGPRGAGPIVYLAVGASWLFVVLYGFMKSGPGWQIGLAGAVIFVLYVGLLCLIVWRTNPDRKRPPIPTSGPPAR